MATDYNLADPLRYGAVRRRIAEQDRRQRLANRGIDEAMDFARTRPMIITSDEGQVPDSAFRNRNSFANVEGNVDTVPGRAQGNSMQRRASRTDVARGGSVSAPNISSNPQSERERKQRVSELDSALFDLRARGGGLNMASKRRLYGDLIGEKNRLTSTAYQGQTERDIARARMQSDVAQTNASLAERAAYRRDAAQMFDTEASDRRFEFDTNRSDELRKLNAPLTEKERLEMRVLDATARREDDAYAVGRDAALNEGFQADVAAYLENNPGGTFEQAQNYALENSLQGTSPMSAAGRSILEQQGDAARRRLDTGTSFVEDFIAGRPRLPLVQKTTAESNLGRLKIGDLEYAPTGGPLGFVRRLVGAPAYDVTPRGMMNDDRAPRYRVSAEEASAAIRQQNLLRDRSKRQKEGF